MLREKGGKVKHGISNWSTAIAVLREHLARRIGETLPASAGTERKTLTSVFSFLYTK
jgi:hypothetical protein